MKASAPYAQEHFADLLDTAKTGEEVEVARLDHTFHRILCAGRGELRVPTEAEWSATDQNVESEMYEAPLTTSSEV